MIETKKIYEITPIVYTYIITAITAIIILYSIDLIDTEKKITYESIGGALITIIGLILFYQRLKKQQKQINIQINQLEIQTDQLKIQINQRVDDRFNSAINLLGSSETSARTGAIYALYELAIEEEKYRSQIAQILCSHIRSKTNETEYKDTHRKRPSNEIQTTIDLLFKKKVCIQKSLQKKLDFLRQICHTLTLCGRILMIRCVVGWILRMHSVRERILVMHSIRRWILRMHSVRERIFGWLSFRR